MAIHWTWKQHFGLHAPATMADYSAETQHLFPQDKSKCPESSTAQRDATLAFPAFQSVDCCIVYGHTWILSCLVRTGKGEIEESSALSC